MVQRAVVAAQTWNIFLAVHAIQYKVFLLNSRLRDKNYKEIAPTAVPVTRAKALSFISIH